MSAQDYVITITDGTTTATLTSSPFGLRSYIPNPPSPDAVDSLDDRATVSESLTLRILDGSSPNNVAEVNAIETLLNQGLKAQNDVSLARVYLTLKNTSGGTEYRSEIVRGQVDWDGRTLGKLWVSNAALIRIYVERLWFFEATTAVQVQVSNHLVTNNTSGAPVHNPRITTTSTGISFTSGTKTIADSNNGLANYLSGDTIWVVGSTSNDGEYTVDSGGTAASLTVDQVLTTEAAGDTVTIIGALNNYIEVAAADADGVVNSPVRLELTNNNGAAVTFEDIHIGISHMNDIANFGFTLEAEDGNGGTTTENAAASGANYRAITWPGSSEVQVWTYALTKTVLAAARGGYFLPVVRLQGGTIASTLSLRVNLKLANTIVYEGALVALTADDYLQPLGTIQLPPYLERQTAPKALTLSLRAVKTGGGAINLDYIQLIPLDGYRFLRQLNYAVPDNNTLFVDELWDRRGMVYGGDSTGGYYRVWVKRGTKLALQPATKQRIYILHDESDNTSNIGREFTSKLYYRPRRLTL